MLTPNRSDKMLVVVATLLFFGVASSAVDSVAQVGIAGGLNFESLDDIQTGSRRATFDNATGYHIGVFLDIGAGMLAVRPGVYLRDLGTFQLTEGSVTEEFDLSMIEVPVDVRLRLMSFPAVKPFAAAGPVLSFPTSNDDEVDSSLKTLNVSGNVGGGLEVAVPGSGIVLIPELRFAFGVSDLIESDSDFSIGGTEFVPEDSPKTSAIMLRLGLRF